MIFYRQFKLMLMAAFLLSCSVEDLERQGVQVYNNIGEASLSQINQAGLLGDGEEACAYYDTSLTLNGEEVYLVTDKRVIHSAKGRVSAMNLSAVKTVEKQSDNIVVTDGNTKMYLNILVDIDLFMTVLEEKIAQSTPPEPAAQVPSAAPVPEPAPQEQQNGAAEAAPATESEPSISQPPQNNGGSQAPPQRRSRPRKR